MAFLFLPQPQRVHFDRVNYDSRESQLLDYESSTAVYVGNLSFYTSEDQIWEHFSRCGRIKQVIMGLNREKQVPCGFCFVVYFTRDAALVADRLLSNSKLDGRVIRVSLDSGFVEGRQYGRGKSGAQVRDELRLDYDPGRGGAGVLAAKGKSHGVRVVTLDGAWPLHPSPPPNGPPPPPPTPRPRPTKTP